MTYDLRFFQTHDQVKEREVMMVVETGSLNYNLQTKDSDRDFQVFVMPTFEDLYHRRMYASEFKSEAFDFKVHDVRYLEHQLLKSNPNFLDMLFSQNVVYVHSMLQFLFDEREQLAKSDMGRLFMSVKGLFKNAQNRVFSHTDPTLFNLKQLSHMQRALFLLEDFRDNLLEGKENPYQEALFLKKGSGRHDALMHCKLREVLQTDGEQVRVYDYDALPEKDQQEYMDMTKENFTDLEAQLQELNEDFYSLQVTDVEYLESVRQYLIQELEGYLKDSLSGTSDEF